MQGLGDRFWSPTPVLNVLVNTPRISKSLALAGQWLIFEPMLVHKYTTIGSKMNRSLFRYTQLNLKTTTLRRAEVFPPTGAFGATAALSRPQTRSVEL